MTQFFKTETIKYLNYTSPTVATLPLGSFVKVGGQGYYVNEDLTVDITLLGLGGLDVTPVSAGNFYKVFLVIDPFDNPKLIATLQLNELPAGYTVARYVGALRIDLNSEIAEVFAYDYQDLSFKPVFNIPTKVIDIYSANGASLAGAAAGFITNFTNLVNDNNTGLLSQTASRLTANKKVRLDVSWSWVADTGSGNTAIVTLYKNGSSKNLGMNPSNQTFRANTSVEVDLDVGDYIEFYKESAVAGVTSVFYSISVESLPEDNISLSSSIVRSDELDYTFATPAQFTLATLPNAPRGTFITGSAISGSNAITQNSTPPTQTTTDMKLNGIQIFTRAFNANSNGNSPAYFAIQVGKGLKGEKFNLFKNTLRTITGSLDNIFSGVIERGLTFKEYNPTTGILVFNALHNVSSTTTTKNFLFEDNTEQTNGYIKFNLSESPLNIGLDVDTIKPERLITATGEAPSYSARAWVNFNGTGTVAIRSAGNVSSITDNGVGDYTINFSIPMLDANYSFSAGCGNTSAGGYARIVDNVNPLTTSLRVNTLNNTGTAAIDHTYATFSFFR